MAGHMGDRRVTTQNLKVVKTTLCAADHGRGCGSGPKGRLDPDPRRRQEGGTQGAAIPGFVQPAAAAAGESK